MPKTCILSALLLLFNCSGPTVKPDTIYKAKEAFDAQNYDQAILQLNRILGQDRKNEEALLLKSRALEQSGQQEAAIQTLGKAIQANPQNHEALSFRAVMLANQGNYTAAQADIDKAIKIVPGNPDYKIELGINQQQQGKHEAAIALFNEVINQRPENENAYYLRGISRQKLGKDLRAMKDFDMAIRLNQTIPEFFNKRAFLLEKQEKYADAIDNFSKIIALAPKDNSNNQLAIAFNNRGHARYKTGELGNALNDINYSLKLFDANSYAYRNRALVHFASKLNTEGCRDVETGLKLGFSKAYGNELADLQQQYCKK